ncbi:MAG: hypothetical protein AAF311_09340 [Pseudomonadota bacterium]
MTTPTIRHAIFDDYDSASRAIAGLRDNGVHDEHISVIGRDDNVLAETDVSGETIEATKDIVGKAALGSGVGALLGVAALAIPGVGPFVAAGAIAEAAAGGAALTGAAAGAVTGGLVGALEDHGIPEEDARFYNDTLTDGRTLVTYDATGATHPDIVSGDLLYNAGGYSRTRTAMAA